MATLVKLSLDFRSNKISAWLPPVVAPGIVMLLGAKWEPWVLMWALALSVYTGLKWLTFVDSAVSIRRPVWRFVAYLIIWPGYNLETLHCSSKIL